MLIPHLLTTLLSPSSSPRAILVVLCCASWGGTAGRCTAWWALARSAAPWRTNPAFSPAPPPTFPGSRQHASGTFSCTKRATRLSADSKHKLCFMFEVYRWLFLLKVSKPQFIIHVPPTRSPFLGLTQQPLQDVNTCSECAIIVL